MHRILMYWRKTTIHIHHDSCPSEISPSGENHNGQLSQLYHTSWYDKIFVECVSCDFIAMLNARTDNKRRRSCFTQDYIPFHTLSVLRSLHYLQGYKLVLDTRSQLKLNTSINSKQHVSLRPLIRKRSPENVTETQKVLRCVKR